MEHFLGKVLQTEIENRCKEIIAHEHSDVIGVERVQRFVPTPQRTIIDYIIVNEGRGVQQLNYGRHAYGIIAGGAAREPVTERQHNRTYMLSLAFLQPVQRIVG